MSVIVVGVNHHTSPLPVLERLTPRSCRARRFTAGPATTRGPSCCDVQPDRDHLVGERFHGAFADATDLLADVSGCPSTSCTRTSTSSTTRPPRAISSRSPAGSIGRARRGRDLGQCAAPPPSPAARRTAPTMQLSTGTAAGKRLAPTPASLGTTSISHAAVEMAAQALGSPDGAMCSWSVPVRWAAGRHCPACRRRARDRGGQPHAVGAASWPPSTDGERPRRAARSARRRAGRGHKFRWCHDARRRPVAARAAVGPLLIVDIAVPRNVDPAVAALHGVTLFDLDDRPLDEAGRLPARPSSTVLRSSPTRSGATC